MTTKLDVIAPDALLTVVGGLTTKQAQREADAVDWASKQLGGSAVFLGNANGTAGGPTLSNRGVLVSTGQGGPVRNFLGHVTFGRSGNPVHLNATRR